MQVSVGQATLELVEGDITRQDTDAIVNAANSSLLGGGGVDGAIHRAAGPELLAETRKMGGCHTGDAKISGGYRLPAKYVIHTVGPVYHQGSPESPRLLASAYQRSLEVAVENGLHSVAFPAISTGVYGYPMDDAAEVALTTVRNFLAQQDQIKLVRFVLFGAAALQTYEKTLTRLWSNDPG